MVASMQCISPDWDVAEKIVACVTSREGGASEPPYHSLNFAKHVGDEERNVDQNRKLLAARLDPNLRWQWLQQNHGVETVTITEAAEPITADGLLTREPGVVCCVLTADCLPVFFAAKDGSEIALVHAGWRGLAAGILENAVAKFASTTKDLCVWLGPAIGPCHFEVGSEVKAAFSSQAQSPAEKSALQSCFKATSNPQKTMADLYAIARIKLARLGLSNVYGGDRCTYCEAEEFYSFRREGITGRMLSMIYIDTANSE